MRARVAAWPRGRVTRTTGVRVTLWYAPSAREISGCGRQCETMRHGALIAKALARIRRGIMANVTDREHAEQDVRAFREMMNAFGDRIHSYCQRGLRESALAAA